MLKVSIKMRAAESLLMFSVHLIGDAEGLLGLPENDAHLGFLTIFGKITKNGTRRYMIYVHVLDEGLCFVCPFIQFKCGGFISC